MLVIKRMYIYMKSFWRGRQWRDQDRSIVRSVQKVSVGIKILIWWLLRNGENKLKLYNMLETTFIQILKSTLSMLVLIGFRLVYSLNPQYLHIIQYLRPHLTIISLIFLVSGKKNHFIIIFARTEQKNYPFIQ